MNVVESGQPHKSPLNRERNELHRVADSITLRLPHHNITLIPPTQVVTSEDIRKLFPTGPVFVCDFHVKGIEDGKGYPYYLSNQIGYRKESITNIDHHAPTAEMEQFISSGVLASNYVLKHSAIPNIVPIVINHVDCDSVISSAILRGILPPSQFFQDAVIAADHTGKFHPVAHLLQSLDPQRDVEFSLRNLALLLKGEPLESRAQELVEIRNQERRLAERIKSEGLSKIFGDLVLIEAPRQISGELFPALFPDAKLILITKPSKKKEGNFEMKLRLGLAAPKGFTLNRINIAAVDPGFGGRWNAGANSRAGGSAVSPHQYAALLSEKLAQALACQV